MIVSPSSAQSVVVAVTSSVNAWYDVVALESTLRNSVLPSALLSEIVSPIVKYPADDSGPSTGFPSAAAKPRAEDRSQHEPQRTTHCPFRSKVQPGRLRGHVPWSCR